MIRPVVRVANVPAEPVRADRVLPLSHHDILPLVAPFSRVGWRVDLAASRRADRRIEFVARAHAAGTATPALNESLSLHVPLRGSKRLVRRLAFVGATRQADASTAVEAPADTLPLLAVLTVTGADTGAMLEQLERLPPARQFECVDGVWLARSYQVDLDDDAAASAPPVTLVSAQAHVAGITLDIDAQTDYPLLLQLAAPAGELLMIPDDLLAVIGRRWRPLRNFDSHWRGTIGVSQNEPARSRESETLLRRTIAHLASTLTESPARFHDQFRRQRWRVLLRRLQPLLGVLVLVAASIGLGQYSIDENSILRALMLHAPPLMLIALFAMREMPRFEIPSWPRRLAQPAWRIVPAHVPASGRTA